MPFTFGNSAGIPVSPRLGRDASHGLPCKCRFPPTLICSKFGGRERRLLPYKFRSPPTDRLLKLSGRDFSRLRLKVRYPVHWMSPKISGSLAMLQYPKLQRSSSPLASKLRPLRISSRSVAGLTNLISRATISVAVRCLPLLNNLGTSCRTSNHNTHA